MESDDRQFSADKLRDRNLILALVNSALHPVHKVPTYFFQMLNPNTKEELGSINLRVGSDFHIEQYAGHIGYAVHPAHRGHRYASRALRLLMPLALECKINPLWITCDPDNFASRHTCEAVGAKFVEIVDVPETCIIHQRGHFKKCRYRLTL